MCRSARHAVSPLLACVVAVCLVARTAAEPEQVHLSLTPSDDEMIVWWMTQKDKGEPSTVRYGFSKDKLDKEAVATSEPFTYEEGRYESGYIHEVKLEGLWQGGTEYFYQCGNPEDGWSPIYSFRTRRSPDGTVRFPIIADQGVTKASKSVMERIMSGGISSYDFWIHLGDMSYADYKEPAFWDTYGHEMEPFTSRLPGAAVVGNHEREGPENTIHAYLARWRNGQTGEGVEKCVWSFSYGPVQIIILSSEHGLESTGEQSDGTQTKMLEAYLQEANTFENRQARPWIIVAIHRPFFSDGRKNLRDYHADRDGLIELIEKYHVDLVLAGHCHNYERLYPYKFDSEVVTTKGIGSSSKPYVTYALWPQKQGSLGTVQLIVGTGGYGTSRKCERQDGLTLGDTELVDGYGFIEVNRQQLVFKMILDNGKVLDEFKMCTRADCEPPLPLQD